MIADIFLTGLLVFLNGFFVAAEFAIVKVRASQVDIKASQGNKLAKSSQHILENLDKYLSTCQLGITLASLALGWIGEQVVTRIVANIGSHFGWNINPEDPTGIGVVIAFILITILHIVLGEQAPKTAAIRNPLFHTMIVAIPLRVMYTIFSPFIWILNSLSSLTLRILGLGKATHSEIHSEEEIRMLLTESEEGGAIKPSENELIQNVFEFDDRVVRQILIPRTKISAIDVESSKEEVIQQVIEEGYSRLPVYQDSLDNIIGIIYTKDLIRAMHERNFKGVSSLIRPAYFIPLSKRINDLLREFQTQHIQMAIVTNEFGGTAGIVTMEDIIEELVGEIQDEHDDEQPPIVQAGEHEFIVNCQISISDANSMLPAALPENSQYETVSGYINFIFRKIPALNEQKQSDGYQIRILKRNPQQVESIRLKLIKP